MSKYIFSKTSKLLRPKHIDTDTFVSASYGEVFADYEPIDRPARIYHFSGSSAYLSQEYLYVRSLKNIINYYKSQDSIFNYDNLINKPLTLIAFNSVHYGSGIEKGSVEFKYYLSGSKIAEASDYREDGVIYSGSAENTGSNTPIGFVLYKEGFIILNNTSSLYNIQADYSSSYTGQFTDNPRWIYSSISSSASLVGTIDYNISSDLTSYLTFVHANKYELNHSNNLTYLESGSYSYMTSSNSFVENDKIKIKNINKSTFVSGSSTQDKEVFITRIGLYDKEKKLLGIASLANPVRKTENREFIFKLKIDI